MLIRKTTMLAGLVLAVAALIPASALAKKGGETAVLPASAHPHGQTYSQWAARWWQWIMAEPVSTNPNLDTTGEFCDRG
ncbi:MAG: hypothetical protein ACXWOV_17140, partial [Isosphaeraceae bacterium]